MKMRWHKKMGRIIRGKIRSKVLSKYGVGILAETKNGKLIVEAGDFGVGRALLDAGEYSYGEIQWVRECIKQKVNTIVIIGTHIGSLLIPFSKNCNKIYGYEADKINYDLLVDNIKLNNVINANVFNNAIGDIAQTVNIKRNIINTGNTSVSVGNAISDAKVEMVTIDSLFENEALDLVVIDIEGYELHALKGGGKTLKNISMLYIEFAPEQLNEHGTDPEVLLNTLADNFNYLHFPGKENTASYAIKDGIDKILVEMHVRGYLKNLLCSKNKL